MIRRMILPVFLAALIASPIVVNAQDAQPQPPADGGNRDRGGDRNRGGDRGNWDPAAMRERMNTFMKERLGANDDEFKVIQPKLEKVFELQRDSRGGRTFGRGGPGGRSDSEQQPQSAAQQASHDLDELLQNKDASAEDIAKKLTALREARAKAKTELTSAQKDLKEILTQRQEAILVQMGMLE